MKLSAIIIARDEEKNIGRCLDSLRECIDETVVFVDDRTKDRTAEIVRDKGAVYEVAQWQGYSATKENLLKKTTNAWVLWIDADEALTPALIEEIKQFKQSTPSYSAYSIPRKANFLGKWIMHSGWYPGRVVRLFDKTVTSFSDKSVHEHLVVNGKTGMLYQDIEHYTDPSINHYYDKFNVYTTLAAEEMNKRGKKVSITDLLLRPPFLFLKMYILKAGFLDGLQGFILAVFSSNYVFTKYCKLMELTRFSKQDQISSH